MNFIPAIPEIFATEYGLIQYVPTVVPCYINPEELLSMYCL